MTGSSILWMVQVLWEAQVLCVFHVRHDYDRLKYFMNGSSINKDIFCGIFDFKNNPYGKFFFFSMLTYTFCLSAPRWQRQWMQRRWNAQQQHSTQRDGWTLISQKSLAKTSSVALATSSKTRRGVMAVLIPRRSTVHELVEAHCASAATFSNPFGGGRGGRRPPWWDCSGGVWRATAHWSRSA